MDQKSPLSPETTLSEESTLSKETRVSKETLTSETYDQIYSYCLRRLPDRESAEDTAQEVFCAFWEGPEFTDGRVALGWLYRVAKSKISDFYRARDRRLKNEVPIPPEDLPETAVPTAADDTPKGTDAETLGLEGVLGEGVRALSDGERRLFRQVWIEKIPYDRLAAEYACTEGAVRTKVSRLKKKLAGLLRQFLWPVLLGAILRFFAERM